MLMEIQKRKIVLGYKNTLLMPKNVCTSFNPLEPPLRQTAHPRRRRCGRR